MKKEVSKKQPKVSIVIINYNGVDLLPTCIKSLKKLDYANKEIFMVDQGSSDNSVSFIRKKFPEVTVIENQNTGYAGGANKAYDSTNGKYLIVMNADVTLDKDYLKILIKRLEEDTKIGAITGKILKTIPVHKNGKELKKYTPIIDTTGLLAFKNRRVVDRGQGFEDKGQFEKTEEVFGISGCIALYRRLALKDIAVPTNSKLAENGMEVWDYDFFMYKEDIDTSWRLNLRGWKCVYEPKALGYHARGTKVLKRYTNKEVLKHRKSVPELAKYHSYKNQKLMQIKNETGGDILRNLPLLLFREILINGYVFLREPKTFSAFFKLLTQLPRAFKKRRYIQQHRKIDSMSNFLKGKPGDAC